LHGFKSRSEEWPRPPEPPAASGILVRSLHATTECEFGLAAKKPDRWNRLGLWIDQNERTLDGNITAAHPLSARPHKSDGVLDHLKAKPLRGGPPGRP
jgi:hypothetical protein